jgi:1-phosphofructokinase family hexose kinase
VSGHGPGAGRNLVLTVTPNPSLDLLFAASDLVWDDANRLPDPRRRAGGQGVNVSRAARALGASSEAIALLGGRTGDELADMLRTEGTPLRAVRGAAETRIFVAVRETGTGRSLLLNARGPARSAGEAEALAGAVAAALEEVQPVWLACCGSLPAGFPPDFYARLMVLARRCGCRVVVDCDGEPLRLAAEAGCDLLVPNQHEAARLAGLPTDDVTGAVAAARTLCLRGTPLVAVTLGAAGAVLATPQAVWHAPAPRAATADDGRSFRSGSAVGAGDAFLAGLLAALRHTADSRAVLRYAVAAGSAVLLSTGTTLLAAADVDSLLSEPDDVAEM